MGILGLFKKNKAELPDEQKKWNKMWELWTEGRADSSYAELMTYQSEVNNGGHEQYFLNLENRGSLQREMTALDAVLPAKLQNNLRDAYKAYATLSEKENGKTEAALEPFDEMFYENEDEITRILKEYADKIKL